MSGMGGTEGHRRPRTARRAGRAAGAGRNHRSHAEKKSRPWQTRGTSVRLTALDDLNREKKTGARPQSKHNRAPPLSAAAQSGHQSFHQKQHCTLPRERTQLLHFSMHKILATQLHIQLSGRIADKGPSADSQVGKSELKTTRTT